MLKLYNSVLLVAYEKNKNEFADNKANEKNIINLGRFLMSFKIELKIFGLMSKFRAFYNQIKPFPITHDQNIDIP